MPGVNLGAALPSCPQRRSLTGATEVVAFQDDYLKPNFLSLPSISYDL